MFKRPSSRRRSHPAEVQLNLVPMLDALVTMISFLMYTMAFISLSMLESPLPMVDTNQNLQELKERPLQLTVTLKENEVLIWSPFDLIPQINVQNTAEGAVNALKLHEELVAIKQKFPTETKVILVPKPETSYETIVAVIDAARSLNKTDPLISVKNASGVEEQVKTLFGEVVFGNLLGGDEP